MRAVNQPRTTELAVDLGQSPANMVILSAADSDLAPLITAQNYSVGEKVDAPSLRLAHLLQLGHAASIDLYAEKVLAKAKIVVVRLLGGVRYWPYGVELLRGLAERNGIKLALLSGEPEQDQDLSAQSNLPPRILAQLHDYFAQGGVDNGIALLRLMADLIDHQAAPLDKLQFIASKITPPFGVYDWKNPARQNLPQNAPIIPIIFYRALLVTGDVLVVNALAQALARRGLAARPFFVPSLKDADALRYLRAEFAAAAPATIISLTNFAAAAIDNNESNLNFLGLDCPIIQAIQASDDVDSWRAGNYGLTPRDLAMAVMLPELDGRLHGRIISHKATSIVDPVTEFAAAHHEPVPELIDAMADLVVAWVRLRYRANRDKKIALMLGNYPVRDGRMANGVGLDTPQATVDILAQMQGAGYEITDAPPNAQSLMDSLQSGATNDLAQRLARMGAIFGDQQTVYYSLADYQREFAKFSPDLQQNIIEKWGGAESDPFLTKISTGEFAFPLAAKIYGNVVVMLQPPRGYERGIGDEAGNLHSNYHDPALIPPHYYWACYAWLKSSFQADALVQIGKHGTLEWLPGKSVALSHDCVPAAMLGSLPLIYPFIVNDPGEGSQAKRRSAALVIDHLTPPLTEAGLYGAAAQLESLIDEYYEASHLNSKRQKFLLSEIRELAERTGIAKESGINLGDISSQHELLPQIDAYLCDLKEWQIRDGLHSFGKSPAGEPEINMLLALVRVPRGDGRGEGASLLRALAHDFDLRPSPDQAIFDPLTADGSVAWQGNKPAELAAIDNAPWRHCGDTRARLELYGLVLIRQMVTGIPTHSTEHLIATLPVLTWLQQSLLPRLRHSGASEMAGLLAALAGKFVAPGPSGAPSRGRPDTLPTGRNFYSLDARAMPTAAAWRVGFHSASLMLQRHEQEHGQPLLRLVLSCWGTAQMRTGGDDIAQALALIGVQPEWEPESGRVIGFDIMPVSALGRPRVDVTLRISGFFRDAFPNLIDLFDRASRAVAAIPTEIESSEENPLAESYRLRYAALQSQGMVADHAKLLAGYRVFGAKPGSYGAGLQHIIDHNHWQSPQELADVFLSWSRYAYGSDHKGGAVAAGDRLPPAIAAAAQENQLRSVLAACQAVVQNQDNREHDVLDSDDYYQFEGGLAATIQNLTGHLPSLYHNDHSLPDRPVIRSLAQELSRVVRARVTNPRWLDGVRRHGYKGAAEMAASLDYMAAFQALTGLISNDQFDAVYQAFLADEISREFLQTHNPAALQEMADKFNQLLDRGLWQPQRNATHQEIAAFRVRDYSLR